MLISYTAAADDQAGLEAALPLLKERLPQGDGTVYPFEWKKENLNEGFMTSSQVNYLARCGAKEPIASSRAPEEKTAAHEPARQSTKQGQNRSTQSRKTAGSRSSGSRSTTARSSSAKSRSTAGRKKKQRRTGNKTVFIVLLAVLLLGLAVRAWSMGAA